MRGEILNFKLIVINRTLDFSTSIFLSTKISPVEMTHRPMCHLE